MALKLDVISSHVGTCFGPIQNYMALKQAPETGIYLSSFGPIQNYMALKLIVIIFVDSFRFGPIQNYMALKRFLSMISK